jgi:hypothetical protein
MVHRTPPGASQSVDFEKVDDWKNEVVCKRLKT